MLNVFQGKCVHVKANAKCNSADISIRYLFSNPHTKRNYCKQSNAEQSKRKYKMQTCDASGELEKIHLTLEFKIK